jgi:hypothetical protein
LFVGDCHEAVQGKAGQNLDPSAIRQAMKDTINSNIKVRMAAFNYGISKAKQSCHLLKLPEQNPLLILSTQLEMASIRILRTTQEF